MRIFRLTILVLCLNVWIGPVAPVAYGADELAGKKKEMQRIKREMLEKKRNIERADQKERSVLGEIEKIDKAIQADRSELARQEKQLSEVESSLNYVEKTNVSASRDLVKLKQMYRDRIRALYKMGRSGYAVTVLSSESLTSALKRIKYLAAVSEHDRRIILNYRTSLDALSQRQVEIEKRTEDILLRKQLIETKRMDLETQRSKKSAILASVKQEKSAYERMLRELEESSANLWTIIRKTEQERESARKEAARKAKQSAKAVHRPVPQTYRGGLPWPLPGAVITQFGLQQHPEFGTTVFRRGIEIDALPGEEVRAVDGGTVAFAGWQKGYGQLVILDHGSGIYSLYGHLSRHDFNKGDKVQRGQTIGSVGDTGSSRGAKLYFEIRSNGEAQDPLTWLAKR